MRKHTKKEKRVYTLFNIVSVLVPILSGMFGGAKIGIIGSILGGILVAYAPYISFHIPFKKDFKAGKIYTFLVYYEALMLILYVIYVF